MINGCRHLLSRNMPFVTTQVTHPSDTAQAPVPNVESLPHCGDMENLLSEVVADTSVFQREIVALLYLTAHTAFESGDLLDQTTG